MELGNFSGSDVLVVRKSIANLSITDTKTVNDFILEYVNLSRLNHPNIIHIIGGSYDKISPYIIQEYAPYGSLFEVLKDKIVMPDISAELCTRIAKDIAKGLAYVHKKGIIHRDVKSSNVMIFSSNPSEVCAKLGDFGSSKKMNKVMTIGVGTEKWMSPEVYNGEKYSYPSDVYSMGIVFWELVTRKRPFEDEKSYEGLAKKMASGIALSFTKEECKKYNDVCLVYNDCVKITPSERLTSSQVYMKLSEERIPDPIVPRLKIGKSSSCNTSPRTKNNSFRCLKTFNQN
ncbi:MAG TPA: protein kinase [Nitrosarchaeum sp.]|nr:protein kinase [Nitrosarchaeum sp.]